MLTKNERFNKWRGNRALEEQRYIKSALLVNDYVGSIKQLETIKTEFSSLQSAQYKEFNKYNGRPFGVLLYCKLEIEEALEQLPESAVLEKQLLTNLNNILDQFYHNARNNIAEKINVLFASSKQLLGLNAEQFMNKKQARTLCFDLYTFLNIANLALCNLNIAERLFVNAIISLDIVKQEIASLMRMTENKVDQLDKLLLLERMSQMQGQGAVKKTVQDHFNERFLVLLKTGSSEEQQLFALEKDMEEVTTDIHRLIVQRIMKEEIVLKIQKIHVLFNALNENDKKFSGRKYFLDLINAHTESFNTLMENSDNVKKEQLNEKIAQLKTPDLYQNLSSTILYGMSWISSLFMVIYRYYVPQNIQDAAEKIFITLDSECKRRLKELTQECLFAQQQNLIDAEQEIDRLTHLLSRGDTGFKYSLADESLENLDLLLNANKAAKEAVNDYKRIAKSLEVTVLYLNIIRESNNALTTYIQTHDGFLVRLSNFFAQISTIFKSDTALMIDSAREMKEELGRFELVYKKELAEGMDDIKNNPDINKVIKDRLNYKIQVEMSMGREAFIASSPSKEDVRYLICNLKKLFNVNPVNELQKENTSIPEDSSLLPTPS